MHTLTNANGLVLRSIPLGARIVEMHTPDRAGRLADIVLGLERENDYAGDTFYLGCIAGRCANRIAAGRFTLDGVTHALATNNGPNHLHGGPAGFHTREWLAESLPAADAGRAVCYSLVSPAGDEGYPGTLHASVTYTLTDDDRLVVDMRATTDAPTLCNLAQHVYWNLGGHEAGDILGHTLSLSASRYTPLGATQIPLGELAPVAGTPFDFTVAKPIGRDMTLLRAEPPGYDHNFAVDGEPLAMRPVARLSDPSSGRVLELSANRPGVQFYTGNFLDGTAPGKGGARYGRHAGVCLETQHFPDAINHAPGGDGHWIAPVLRPGEAYRHTMIFRFSTDG